MQDGGAKTLVMPLKNGTQKDLGLGPDFRRDDGKGSELRLQVSWFRTLYLTATRGFSPLHFILAFFLDDGTKKLTKIHKKLKKPCQIKL